MAGASTCQHGCAHARCPRTYGCPDFKIPYPSRGKCPDGISYTLQLCSRSCCGHQATLAERLAGEAYLKAHLNDLLLAEGFESHVLALILHKHDLAKGTRAQHTNLLQV